MLSILIHYAIGCLFLVPEPFLMFFLQCKCAFIEADRMNCFKHLSHREQGTGICRVVVSHNSCERWCTAHKDQRTAARRLYIKWWETSLKTPVISDCVGKCLKANDRPALLTMLFPPHSLPSRVVHLQPGQPWRRAGTFSWRFPTSVTLS